MSEPFEKMTVQELRRVAKEMGVKLGAGISKQGIVEKLTAAAAAKEASPAVPDIRQEAPVRPVRSAAIITDDEPEEDEDDIPILTPNPALQAVSRPTPRPAPSSPSQAGAAASSLSNISSKAPAFTMEGSRAWHNPRAFQAQGTPNYPRPQSWGTPRPTPGGAADQRSYSRLPQQRPDAAPQPARPAAYPQRFGPEQPQAEERPVDYRPAPNHGQADYPAPASRNDYAHRQDYAPPRESAPFSPSASYSRPAQPAYYHKELSGVNPAIPEMLATGECGDGAGVLELHPDGYGFLRTGNYLPGKNDVYVSNAQIRRFGLRSGDYIAGKTRPQRETDRYCALLYITEINGHPAEEMPTRLSFEDLTPIYPQRKMTLAGKEEKDPVLRLIDLLAPIGFGQRAMIVAAPKAGKTTLLKKLANAIGQNHPKAHLMVLLVDERPEEVTDIRESVKGEVVYSTFDEPSENHVRVSELALERALRLVEQKKDVVLLVDSLTRMARAYNTVAPQTARVMTGGLAAGALNKPKRFFGAARCTKEGGTLTIIATALVETGSRMDEVIFEEFKGTGNMELVLDRGLAEKRLFPAVDLSKSGTRHEELLLSKAEMARADKIRALLSTANEENATAQLLAALEDDGSNEQEDQKTDA